jgi:glycosyltransferase involved in cell wall biosynthesis
MLTSDFEGSPNSVKECLACNTPVVSTPVGNVSDLVSGVKGSYVSKTFNADELAELARDVLNSGNYISREYIGRKGLDIATVGTKLLNLYTGLLNS